MGGLEGRAKGKAEQQSRAKQVGDRHVLSSQTLMSILNCLPYAAIAKLRPPLSTKVCLRLDNISTSLGPPDLCSDGQAFVPRYIVPAIPSLYAADPVCLSTSAVYL